MMIERCFCMALYCDKERKDNSCQKKRKIEWIEDQMKNGEG